MVCDLLALWEEGRDCTYVFEGICGHLAFVYRYILAIAPGHDMIKIFIQFIQKVFSEHILYTRHCFRHCE